MLFKLKIVSDQKRHIEVGEEVVATTTTTILLSMYEQHHDIIYSIIFKMECVTKKLVFDCFLDAGFYKSVFE